MSESFHISDNQQRIMQKYKMRGFQGPKTVLPTGIVIDASRYTGIRPPGSDQSFVLHSPEAYLRHPKPGHRYVWMLRSDDATIGLVETSQMRPVLMDEVDRTKSAEAAFLRAWTGPSGKSYVGWKRLALFEVKPETVDAWYRQPEDYAMARTVGISDSFAENVERTTQGQMEGHISVTKSEVAHG